MTKIDRMCLMIMIGIQNAVYDFLHDEKGDTNFIAMAIIIGIVVIFAGLFLTLGKDLMATVTQKLKDFFSNLSGEGGKSWG